MMSRAGSWRDDARVALVRDQPSYPRTPPFDPSEAYPEWPGAPVSEEENPAYRGVRSLLRALGLDAERYGTESWNPLGRLIKQGDVVAVKPNLVSHLNLRTRSSSPEDTDCLVTHGSVIRATLDYVGKALGGRGRVIVADCPIQDTAWEEVVALVGLNVIAQHFQRRFPGIALEVRDYRRATAVLRGRVMVRRIPDDERTPAGVEVDLGASSLLTPLANVPCEFGVSRYPRYRMLRAHQGERHLYLLAQDLLCADVFINLPKMKSHMKAGVTGALKNLIGIGSHKDYLPHFRYGSPKQGGDEYPDGNWFWDLMWCLRHQDWDRDRGLAKLFFFTLGALCKRLLPLLARLPKESVAMGGGGWHGNDTLWRTVLDVNRAFFYYDRAAGRILADAPPRRYLAILDGLIGGHRESPLAPSPVPSGVLLAARNPAAMDAVATALMGLDIERIPQVGEAFRLEDLPLTSFSPNEIQIVGNRVPQSLEEIYASHWEPKFECSRGYRGHVEYHPRAPSAVSWPEVAGSLADAEQLAE